MKLLLILGSVIALPTFAAGGGDLDASDYTGVSFWLVTAALLEPTSNFLNNDPATLVAAARIK